MKPIDVVEVMDSPGFKVTCYRNIFHLFWEENKILWVRMCDCNSTPTDKATKLTVELSNVDLKNIRDFLQKDPNYFYFSPTNQNCTILRRIQRDTIAEFSKIIEG